MQHVVYEHLQEEGADAQRPLRLSPLNDALSTGDGLPNPTRSYKDRNDKSEVTEAEAVCSNNVQLEVLAFDEDRTIEVLESTTADELGCSGYHFFRFIANSMLLGRYHPR